MIDSRSAGLGEARSWAQTALLDRSGYAEVFSEAREESTSKHKGEVSVFLRMLAVGRSLEFCWTCATVEVSGVPSEGDVERGLSNSIGALFFARSPYPSALSQ